MMPRQEPPGVVTKTSARPVPATLERLRAAVERWDADRLRSTFLAFFAERGHVIVPSASLIPEGDPSVLFTTAGVHPLLPYLLGRPTPPASCSPTARSACGRPTSPRSATARN